MIRRPELSEPFHLRRMTRVNLATDGRSRQPIWWSRRVRAEISGAFAFARFDSRGNLLVACGPQRILLAAFLIRIGLCWNALARGALALLERIGVAAHWPLVSIDGSLHQ